MHFDAVLSEFIHPCSKKRRRAQYSTVAGKCKTTLQSVKHFYEARDKFTFWKTFLPILKHNYMGKKTLLPRTDSSRKGNVPHTGSDAVKGVVVGERGKFMLWLWSKCRK